MATTQTPVRIKFRLRNTAAALALISIASGTALAQDAKVAVDIPAGSLDAALKQFGLETNSQIMFPESVVAGRTVKALKGMFGAKQAISMLLVGTDLQVIQSSDRVFVVKASSAKIPTKQALDTPEQSSSGLRAAAEVQPKNVQAASNDEAVNQSVSESVEVTGIPELMKGLSSNADIARSRDDIQPYVVFDAEAIARSQSSDIQDFLQTRLPMNASSASQLRAPSSTGSANQFNLRGLGQNQTLVLVDGRRLPSVQNGGAFSQADVDGIPLSAIERIEILPTTASGIFGGGATGGAINIITKKDYSGWNFGARWGESFRNDAPEYRLDASGGFTLGENTHVMISASHAETGSLLQGDRGFAAKSRALQYANDPAFFLAATVPPGGYTTNIRSQNGSNLVLKNGTALNSPITFVPVGYTGPASDGGLALVADAGHYNLALPDDTSVTGQPGDLQGLYGGSNQSSAMLGVRHEFGWATAFLNFTYLDDKSVSYTGGSVVPVTAVLPATASDNPFTTAIYARYPATNMGLGTNRADNQSILSTAGFVVPLPYRWSADIEYNWSQAQLNNSASTYLINSSVSTALASGSLNVLQDLNAFPLNWSTYRFPTPERTTGPATTTLSDPVLRISGPIFALPGGDFALTGLVEQRHQGASSVLTSGIVSGSGLTSTIWYPPAAQTTTSYYAEATAPIIAPSNGIPYARLLELSASVRHDDYRSSSANIGGVTLATPGVYPAQTYSANNASATKFTVGGRYSPIDDIILRASYGTGFLPPDISQIVSSTGTNSSPLIDPKRGNVSSTITYSYITGGNPNLQPEQSESFSFGAILTPQFVQGLRLSLDYTRIKKSGEITSLDRQTAINVEDSFPGTIVRAPLTPADAALGYTGGVITAINTPLINVAHTQLEAFDAQADYEIAIDRIGDFHLYGIGTYEPVLDRQLAPNASFISYAGLGPTTGILKWRGNIGFTWDLDAWGFGWNTQFYGSYLGYAPGSSAATATTFALYQGSTRIPAQNYSDVFIRYKLQAAEDFAGGLLNNTQLTFGVQNIFDQSPPILAVGGYSSYGDPRLSRFTIDLRKSL